MNLPSLPFVVLDTETTGFVPKTHRVIEFACVRVVDGKIEKEYEQMFAHPEVPPHVEVLTRIRTENLRGKPTFAEKKAEMFAHFPEGTLIVGQNIGFDIGMLKGEDLDLSSYPCIDTSMLASLVFPELASYSLGYLSTVLHLDHAPKHRALGDVRATLALLEKCCERLLELPPELQKATEEIIAKGSKGYQMLFASLAEQTKNQKLINQKPAWLHSPSPTSSDSTISPIHIPTPSPTTVALLEEPLDPQFPEQVIRGAIDKTDTLHWIAVKNLRSSLRRLPPMPKGAVRILHPPSYLLDPEAKARFEKQETYTADETTLALKLSWYEPVTRDDLPLHGGEEAVWNGKLACTDVCKTYRKQFDKLPGVVLLDHRELLRFLDTEDHPGHKSLKGDTHVIIDDASMLEDTATKAYGWMCVIDDMRAAAQGNALLTHFLDTLQLWIERIRQGQDIRYLVDADLRTPESRGLRETLASVAAKEWPEQIRRSLSDLEKILNPENLAHRLAWIEQRPNGNQFVQSVPERIGSFLARNFFGHLPATLLIPQGSAQMLPEIVPDALKTAPSAFEGAPGSYAVPLSFSAEPTLDALFPNPPTGKTIILLPGKGAIEDLFVKHMERLEKNGVTLICQGMSGGQGRMQAEFIAAPAPAVWLLTPWMFEGLELPPGSVDHLLMKTLPFDHPSHPVLSRRSSRYRDAFGDYCLPRLLHRLFRIIRTYCRFRTAGGDLRILDERLHTKAYGKKVKEYLQKFAATDQPQSVQTVTASEASATISKKSKRDPNAQMTLF